MAKKKNKNLRMQVSSNDIRKKLRNELHFNEQRFSSGTGAHQNKKKQIPRKNKYKDKY